jgi:hypothetical protein
MNVAYNIMNKTQVKGDAFGKKLNSSVLSLLNIGASDSLETTEELMMMTGSL